MCLPIEIGRDADGDIAPVEKVNISHCNHDNDENEIRFFCTLFRCVDLVSKPERILLICLNNHSQIWCGTRFRFLFL